MRAADLWIKLGVCAGVSLGGYMLYLAWAMVVMASHVPRRSARAWIRAFCTETAWVVLVQPWLLFFYVFGRSFGGPSEGLPVIFVHGFMQNRVDFLRMARVVARRKIGPCFGINYNWLAPIETSAETLAAFVERVRRETHADRVALVCHSMGGLVAREYMATGGADKVAACVTIATPHAGVMWTGPVLAPVIRQLQARSAFHQERERLAVPAYSIYSSHDQVVYPASTSSIAHRGGQDLLASDRGHFSILFQPSVCEAVARYLLEMSRK